MNSNNNPHDKQPLVRTVTDNSRTIVIYSHNQEFEPHPLKFYGETNPNDMNALIRETIENIKNHMRKPQLRVWDSSQGVEIDYYNEPIYQHETIFLSEAQPTTQFEIQTFTTGNPLVTDHKIKNVRGELANSPQTPSKEMNVFSDFKQDDASLRKTEGPIVTEKVPKKYAKIDKSADKSRERSISAAKMVLQKSFSPNKVENTNGVLFESYHQQNFSNFDAVDQPESKRIETVNSDFSPAGKEIQQRDFGQADIHPQPQEINLKEEQAPEPDLKRQVKVPFPPTGHIATTSIEGNDPNIYCLHKNIMPFSYMLNAMPNTYNEKAPPPTYLPYSLLSEKRGLERDDAFYGLEITNSGVLKLTDPEILKNQKGLIPEVLQSLFKSIAEGRGVVGVSLPIRVFEPRSLIERLCDVWSYVPTYLLQATQINDPIERIKKVITMLIAALHLNAKQTKPFNPILGETYQAYFPEHGITIDIEHTSHHPPIANFLIKHEDFQMWGQFEFIAKLEGFTKNVITMLQEGATYIQFKDGQKLTCYCPYLYLEGMMHGDRTAKFIGVLKVIDEANKVKAVVKFGEGGDIETLPKKRVDVFHGKLYKYKPQEVTKATKKSAKNEDLKFGDMESPICDIYGSMLEYLKMGNEETWNVHRDRPTQVIPVENPLPSDSRFREDLIWVKRGNKKYGQEWKLILEVRQRYEKKLRLDYAKAHGKKKH